MNKKATFMTSTALISIGKAGYLMLLRMRDRLDRVMNSLQPLAAVLARLYVAQVFFASGLTKLRDWDITLALFTEEYKVPLLPPEVAALMGTAGEIGLPVLLVLGLGGRFASLGLSVVNVVAVLSLMEIAPAALQQHITWGILLAALAIFGNGRWATDTMLKAKAD
jgi:putative oxidoreductase